MKMDDLIMNTLVQTRAVAEATADPATMQYVQDCLTAFFNGDFGKIPEEDIAANNAELKDGEGRVLARYGKFGKLEEDIYIIAVFSAEEPEDENYNNTVVMYRSEY